ncbi:MAG: SLC13 family permease [Anaerolineae bacterium]|nr:SLC13 family permease [Anaerolineae bacterium]
MTASIALLLAILVVAVILFSFEWIAADIVALGILVALILANLLPEGEFFAGFGSDTVIVMLGLLILTAALLRTGVVDEVSRIILNRIGDRADLLLPAVMLTAAILSSFISNTATTAFFLPIVVSLARRMRLETSQLLMPLAFASILASSVSLVGSSTNIVVSGLISQQGMPSLSMFEMAPVGIPIAIIGLLYMLIIGRRFIPNRTPAKALTEEFGLRSYLAEIRIRPDSPLVGMTLAQAELGNKLDLTVLSIFRDEKRHLVPQAETTLQAGDALLIEGRREDILKVEDMVGVEIQTDADFSDSDLQNVGTQLAEVILLPKSPLLWNTPKGFRLRERYGLQVLAIQRHEGTIRRRISQVQMRMGDVLLVQGPRANITVLQEDGAFRILDVIQDVRPRRRRAHVAMAIFAGALVAAALNLLALPVAVLGGAMLVFLTGCITPEEAYREVEWRILILVGCMLSLGVAMEYTGTAQFLAAQLLHMIGTASPIWLLTAFFVLTMLLTQPMSNQAAAAVVLPIALQTALQMGLNPRTFAIMIAVGASCSFITPLEPSCMLVYGSGHYRFMDFIKIGLPLTVLIYLIAIGLVPLFWPL